MVNFIGTVIVFSLMCGAFALDTNFSPVLVFKNKENKKAFAKGIVSSTTPLNQREFEQDFGGFGADQKVVFLVTDDLSPEDLSIKNAHHQRGFQNLASQVDIIKYMPYVENTVDNKITMGVKRYALTSTNELEPEPSDDARIIIVTLPECDDETESRYHCMAHIDRASFAISQSEKFKDAIFILTSEMNSHLHEVHSRKARDTSGKKEDQTGQLFKSPHSLVYFKALKEHDLKKADTAVTVSAVTANKVNDKEITIDVTSDKYQLALNFRLDESQYVILNTSSSTLNGIPIIIDFDVYMPQNTSYACASSLIFRYRNEKEKESTVDGIYFENLQFQLNYTNNAGDLDRFLDADDCVGFSSPGIWSGLFITFLLLSIVGTGITFIMDIKTMDKFDDPKGKTITINANE